jgi:FMN phosphatase YigB (HAD superfamily)
MFEAAVTYVGEPPERCLMVGDNPHSDAGGAPLGISTLLLPLQREQRPPLLDAVRVLVLGDAA